MGAHKEAIRTWKWEAKLHQAKLLWLEKPSLSNETNSSCVTIVRVT